MMKNKVFQALVIVSTLALAACGHGDTDVKEKLGLKVAPPDEFSVVTRAPLAVPPDYTLRPPRPGADRPNELSVRAETRKTVFGAADTQAAAKASASESGSGDFLSKLGANQADPNIRESINTQVKEMDQKEAPVADRLLFWKEKEVPGKTIDPVEEQQRLKQDAVVAPQAASQAPVTATTKTTTKTSSAAKKPAAQNADDGDEATMGDNGVVTIKKHNEDILNNN